MWQIATIARSVRCLAGVAFRGKSGGIMVRGVVFGRGEHSHKAAYKLGLKVFTRVMWGHLL
jgi:hypothetical protein